jgi:hypothetical protein
MAGIVHSISFLTKDN